MVSREQSRQELLYSQQETLHAKTLENERLLQEIRVKSDLELETRESNLQASLEQKHFIGPNPNPNPNPDASPNPNPKPSPDLQASLDQEQVMSQKSRLDFGVAHKREIIFLESTHEAEVAITLNT